MPSHSALTVRRRVPSAMHGGRGGGACAQVRAHVLTVCRRIRSSSTNVSSTKQRCSTSWMASASASSGTSSSSRASTRPWHRSDSGSTRSAARKTPSPPILRRASSSSAWRKRKPYVRSTARPASSGPPLDHTLRKLTRRRFGRSRLGCTSRGLTQLACVLCGLHWRPPHSRVALACAHVRINSAAVVVSRGCGGVCVCVSRARNCAKSTPQCVLCCAFSPPRAPSVPSRSQYHCASLV